MSSNSPLTLTRTTTVLLEALANERNDVIREQLDGRRRGDISSLAPSSPIEIVDDRDIRKRPAQPP